MTNLLSIWLVIFSPSPYTLYTTITIPSPSVPWRFGHPCWRNNIKDPTLCNIVMLIPNAAHLKKKLWARPPEDTCIPTPRINRGVRRQGHINRSHRCNSVQNMVVWGTMEWSLQLGPTHVDNIAALSRKDRDGWSKMGQTRLESVWPDCHCLIWSDHHAKPQARLSIQTHIHYCPPTTQRTVPQAQKGENHQGHCNQSWNDDTLHSHSTHFTHTHSWSEGSAIIIIDLQPTVLANINYTFLFLWDGTLMA